MVNTCPFGSIEDVVTGGSLCSPLRFVDQVAFSSLLVFKVGAWAYSFLFPKLLPFLAFYAVVRWHFWGTPWRQGLSGFWTTILLVGMPSCWSSSVQSTVVGTIETYWMLHEFSIDAFQGCPFYGGKPIHHPDDQPTMTNQHQGHDGMTDKNAWTKFSM